MTCLESECVEDSHCDADRKCCKNRCGGMVCSRTGKSMQGLIMAKARTKTVPFSLSARISIVISCDY